MSNPITRPLLFSPRTPNIPERSPARSAPSRARTSPGRRSHSSFVACDARIASRSPAGRATVGPKADCARGDRAQRARSQPIRACARRPMSDVCPTTPCACQVIPSFRADPSSDRSRPPTPPAPDPSRARPRSRRGARPRASPADRPRARRRRGGSRDPAARGRRGNAWGCRGIRGIPYRALDSLRGFPYYEV
jgi:hypothetical protein